MKSIQPTAEAGSVSGGQRKILKCLLNVQEEESLKEQLFNADETGLLCKNVVNESR